MDPINFHKNVLLDIVKNVVPTAGADPGGGPRGLENQVFIHFIYFISFFNYHFKMVILVVYLTRNGFVSLFGFIH